MTFLRRPISDRIHKPLTAALAWSGATALVALVIGLAVAGVGWLVTLIGSWLGDATVGVPWHLVRAVVAALAPFVIGASAWAAAYGSSNRATARRALLATAVGVIVAFGAIALMPVAAALLAFGATWSIAVPFQRWGRAGARIAPALVTAIIGVIIVGRVSGARLVIALLAGIIVAAVTTWAGDEIWLLVQRGRGVSGGQDNEDYESSQ